MVTALRRAALALSLLAACAADAANWRAVLSEAGQVKACVEVPGSIDEYVAARAMALPTCRLSLDAVQLSRGFVIVCGPERGYVLFRRQPACLASAGAARAQRQLTAAEVAPEGTASPDRWQDVMVACLRGVTEEVVAARRVQARADACECVSSWAGGFRADADLPRQQGAWEGAVRRCGLAGGDEGLQAEAAALLAAITAPAVQAAAAPKPAAGADVIRKNASYADVMAALREFKAEKVPAGDLLEATYAAPALLAYPDAGGRCVLTFNKGLLSRCQGCDPGRFQCD